MSKAERLLLSFLTIALVIIVVCIDFTLRPLTRHDHWWPRAMPYALGVAGWILASYLYRKFPESGNG